MAFILVGFPIEGFFTQGRKEKENKNRNLKRPFAFNCCVRLWFMQQEKLQLKSSLKSFKRQSFHFHQGLICD